jgi:hypothetical protein
MELLALFGVAALVAGGIWMLNRRPGGAPAAGKVNGRKGDGEYESYVVGEFDYQDALAEIAGGKTEDGVEIHTRARVVFDGFDAEVFIQGKKVGNLSQEMTAELQAALERRGQLRGGFEVPALINGGRRYWGKNHRFNETQFQVYLDILDPEVE